MPIRQVILLRSIDFPLVINEDDQGNPKADGDAGDSAGRDNGDVFALLEQPPGNGKTEQQLAGNLDDLLGRCREHVAVALAVALIDGDDADKKNGG